MPGKADGIAALSQKGFTNKEWTDKLGEDGILKSVGFRQSNPSYLETVFRTNTLDKIKYLKYVAIDDNADMQGARRSKTLPTLLCNLHSPNHFNCRSIFRSSREAKTAGKRKPKGIPPLPEGFNASPFDSWWKLSDSMARRVVKYGLKDEVLEKAKRMCGKNFEDWECPEFEEVKGKLEELERTYKELEKYIGRGEEVPVSEGDNVLHPITKIPSEVVRKYKDILGNERVLTKLVREHIMHRISREKRLWRKEVRTWGFRNIHNILRNPDVVFFDREEKSILYCKRRKVGNRICIAAVVIGAENRHYIYTVEPAPYPPAGLKSGRYVSIYSK